MKSLSPIFLLLLVTGAFSCSNGAERKVVTTEKKKTHIVIQTDKVQADKMLNAKIEGMMCEKGCGSSIRKELMNTNAVESCEFDFESDRKQNTVKIAFDKDKISVDRLITILNQINNKQFKVKETNTTTIVASPDSEESSSDESSSTEEISSIEKEEAHVIAADSTFETPNLLQIFSRLITG
ncbi:MAG: heavy-metal-associated domain-containing protein [Bacteroidota bacterium]